MPKKRHTPEQIIGKLRKAEVLLSQGRTVPEACKQIEVSEQTYYRWRKDIYGVLSVSWGVWGNLPEYPAGTFQNNRPSGGLRR